MLETICKKILQFQFNPFNRPEPIELHRDPNKMAPH